ncbi:YveK family protein [Streptomyces calidiresistens]|uniref:Capsular polysaccharide biosynthesis protein n=1 Tax=Streptomyces calidiresistens TaxID=1485586 RepID=A0A7W3XX05_9ACTN|nr:hypothetical protein [Streptomyces calidiresistens]MBB0230424.1 hypothetical protein [Streptomyces calidiresistens]
MGAGLRRLLRRPAPTAGAAPGTGAPPPAREPGGSREPGPTRPDPRPSPGAGPCGGLLAAARLPLACLLAGALLGAGWSLLSEPRYVSSAHLVVPVPESGDHATAVGLARIHSRLAVEPVILERAAATLGVPAAELRGRIRSAGSPDAPVVEITVTDTDPVRAAETADAVAGALVDRGAELAAPGAGGAIPAPVPLTEARPASSPTSPSLAVSAGAGACAGLIVGVLPGRIRFPGDRRAGSADTSSAPPDPPDAGTPDPGTPDAGTPPWRRREDPDTGALPILPRGHRLRRGPHDRW